MSAVSRKNARTPWPSWPIAVAILVCLAGYTYVRLAYAKPGKPHEPFAASRARAEAEALRVAGWTQAEASFEATLEVPPAAAPVDTLPLEPAAAAELRRLSAENWHLPIEYTDVSAPARLAAGAPLTVDFAAVLDQARAQIVAFDTYRKGADLVVLPRWEPHPEELSARHPRCVGRFTLGTADLPAGTYRVTLLALKSSSQWELTVLPPAAN